MKMIKKMTTVLAVTGLLFISCNTTNGEKTAMKVKLPDGQFATYNLDSKGSLSFNDWDGFNSANKALVDLEIETTPERIDNLNNTVSNLAATIPAWLKNEEVMEDIADVEEEYKKLLEEKNEPAKNVKQNLEELNEKFDDLREELNETIEKYKS
ncbi:hypothetical protein SHK09_03055 [Polaribacter sp. PL03]|uniref:hypothetical protein n=1 Tax=Polaribacter sp. PL03 TaxID=3088353 RepID=UPI0029CB909F|nr:hypothetical protein [Polaribacter sp. PL03]MDX6745761.1 hypothetical protein [Polaribacter sp. PL03]